VWGMHPHLTHMLTQRPRRNRDTQGCCCYCRRQLLLPNDGPGQDSDQKGPRSDGFPKEVMGNITAEACSALPAVCCSARLLVL
jgi:hypothetical protein